jgi:predicted permease
MKPFHCLRALFRKEELDRELSDELAFHLEKQIEQNLAAGMTPEEARYAALRSFGGVEQVKEECRDAWGVRFIDTLLQDIRFALRMLAKNPGFTAVAVLTLALGIGANTAIFSMVDGFFLRSLPAEEPHQLVWMYAMRQGQYVLASYPNYLDLRRQDTVFSGIIALSRHVAQLNIAGETELVRADMVSENYFSVLGINAALGRTFVAGEDWGSHKTPPVVIGHGLWLRRFGADPNIVGRSVVFNGRTSVVLGVAPQWFAGLARGISTEVWLPLNAWSSPGDLQNRGLRDFELLGRLRPGVSLEQVRPELDTISHRFSDAFPATDKGLTFFVSAEADRLREALLPTSLLLGGVGLFLLICCANVSGMMLARAEARRREIAVRMALGCGRARLLRQLLTESLALAVVGGGLGVVLTSFLIRLQPALMPPGPFVMRFDFRVDAPVLAFALGVSMLAALIAGLAPVLKAWKTDVVSALKGEEGKTERGRWWLGGRNLLVVGQVALSLTLTITAGLFLKSLVFSERINPGFDASKKLLIVNVAPSTGPQASNQEFYLPIIQRIRSLPGVRGASYASRMLLSGSGGGVTCEVSIPGVEPPAGQKAYVVRFNSVGRNYFRTVGASVFRGRALDAREESPEQRGVVINEMMAHRFWHDSDPIGRHFVVEGGDYQIVGIVQDGRINDIHEPLEPYIYFSFAQRPLGEGAIIVETVGPPLQLVGAVKQDIRAVDKGATFLSVQTLKELMGYALWGDRMSFLFVGALGCLGIFLTTVGLYGVVAFLVGRRTQEIGICMALGARRQEVFALVLREGLRIALIGIPIGLGAAAVVARLISSQLYGVSSTDLTVFLGSSVLVVAVAAVASYLPARRATKVDPMVALRYE